MSVHVCNLFYILTHLLNNGSGTDNPNTFAKAANPSKKLRAYFNLHRYGKMMLVYWKEHDISAKTVDDNAGQMVAKVHSHIFFCTAEHGEHF